MRERNSDLKLPNKKPSPRAMLPISEVAERLGVSLSFAHKLVRSGELESYMFGRCRRVSERQLQAYVEDCLVEPQDDVTSRRLKYF